MYRHQFIKKKERKASIHVFFYISAKKEILLLRFFFINEKVKIEAATIYMYCTDTNIPRYTYSKRQNSSICNPLGSIPSGSSSACLLSATSGLKKFYSYSTAPIIRIDLGGKCEKYEIEIILQLFLSVELCCKSRLIIVYNTTKNHVFIFDRCIFNIHVPLYMV